MVGVVHLVQRKGCDQASFKMVNLEERSKCLREEVVTSVYHSGKRDIVVCGVFLVGWFGLLGCFCLFFFFGGWLFVLGLGFF